MADIEVGIIMGSQSDWPTMREAAGILDELGVAYETRIVSAHRTPDRLWDYGRAAAGRGLKVIIAGAGGAAHLPGMMASKTRVPVIGVPVQTKALSGVDSLYSIVQMPKGYPVATMAIGAAGAANAGLMAAAILATSDFRLWTERLDAWRAADIYTGLHPRRPADTDRCRPGPPIGILGGADSWGPCSPWPPPASAIAATSTSLARPPPPMSPTPGRRPLTKISRRSAPLPKTATSSPTSSRNIPAPSLDVLAETTPLFPDRRALEVSQDRLNRKKTFLAGLGLATAPFAAVDGPADLHAALARHRHARDPQDLAASGYDGKGQARVMTPDAAEGALATLQGAPAIAEGFVRFSREISVIAARGRDGTGWRPMTPARMSTRTASSPPPPSPAPLPLLQRTDAVLIASRILTALDYVGVMGVELFVTPQGLVVNEIAPRVHNSGALDAGGLRRRPVRTAHPRHRGLAAGQWRAPRQRGDGEPDRR